MSYKDKVTAICDSVERLERRMDAISESDLTRRAAKMAEGKDARQIAILVDHLKSSGRPDFARALEAAGKKSSPTKTAKAPMPSPNSSYGNAPDPDTVARWGKAYAINEVPWSRVVGILKKEQFKKSLIEAVKFHYDRQMARG